MSELSKQSETTFDADELGQYQAVSLSAVFALLLGIASPIALFFPVLLVIPILATISALIALSKLNAEASGLTGARLARIGLAIAIISAVACCSRIALLHMLVNKNPENESQVASLTTLIQPVESGNQE